MDATQRQANAEQLYGRLEEAIAELRKNLATHLNEKPEGLSIDEVKITASFRVLRLDKDAKAAYFTPPVVNLGLIKDPCGAGQVVVREAVIARKSPAVPADA